MHATCFRLLPARPEPCPIRKISTYLTTAVVLLALALFPAGSRAQQGSPVVSGVTPSSGPLDGGIMVTITGTGFTGATGVSYGKVAATQVKVISDTEITATAPAGSAPNASVAVTVTNAAGVSNGESFTYLPIIACNNARHILPAGNAGLDLQISNGVACSVDGSAPDSNYVYRNVNIWGGGSLTFEDAKVNFHAHSILVENQGTLDAGMGTPVAGPISIWLYGAKGDGIPSITCQSGPTCGVPQAVWNSNPLVANNVDMGTMVMPSAPCVKASSIIVDPTAPNPVGDDCFYQYEIFDKGNAPGAFFGSKVLAVSYGGTLVLRGKKGIRQVVPTSTPVGSCPADSVTAIDACPSDSGTSWVRLSKTIASSDLGTSTNNIFVDRPVPTWDIGDQIVLTSTDYLPGHSEQLTITNISSTPTGTMIQVKSSQVADEGIQFPHWGQGYDYGQFETSDGKKTTAGPEDDPNRPPTQASRTLENRAAVALLTRSILIQSEGATPVLMDRVTDPTRYLTEGDPHFPLTAGYYGGHTLVRDGFARFDVQGVEFANLGQGGQIGHYPVHFHMDRGVPQPVATPFFAGTYLADSSIHDSNTRFVTIHATQGVLVARNVGFRSIGHGYYLEDATEINNRLYSNIGIESAAAIYGPQNPRSVPGILSQSGGSDQEIVPFHSDFDHPSIFWIMNTWNDFRYNVAVGAGACGVCYWTPPAYNSGYSVYETWDSYAAMQSNASRAGSVPLENFIGNSCSAAMNAFQTTGNGAVCHGVTSWGDDDPTDTTKLHAVPNPNPTPNAAYPNVLGNDKRQQATVCDASTQDCSKVALCTGADGEEGSCLPTVIDHFSTSFNWAQFNFAAVLLRGWWYLLRDSAITDVQNGGLQMVTGGGYTRSDIAQGFWSLSSHNLFAGNTQPIPATVGAVPDNPFASNAGPFNPHALTCPYGVNGGLYCISPEQGIAFEGAAFSNSQRLLHIYDGPTFEDSDLFADIHTLKISSVKDCRLPGDSTSNPGVCNALNWENAYNSGVLQYPAGNQSTANCVLPNAAISWKQPNGFYYPPAFDSRNLYFAPSVDIRHFVIDPLWLPGGFLPDLNATKDFYCSWQPADFSQFSDIDRQTELSDLDGSLTGLTSLTENSVVGSTISVNNDPVSDPAVQPPSILNPLSSNFFNAPVITPECASNVPASAASPGVPEATATVNTSPYEYVTTAVFPACLKNGTCANWSTNCGDQSCYGVPLYRQFLTDAEMTSWNTNHATYPAIRMQGQGTGQRSNLTMNHGSYYFDTTVPLAVQSAGNTGPYTKPVTNYNVFAASQAYYVYLLYAKPSLYQKYSFYIGKDLQPSDVQAAITAGIVNPFNGTVPTFLKEGDPGFPAGVTPNWIPEPDYDRNTGVITVTIDLSKQAAVFANEVPNSCQPTTYCSVHANGSCGCKAGSACTDDSVCAWGTKEIDCPTFGCFGFELTLPASFQTGTMANPIPPPDPVLFSASGDDYFTTGYVKFMAAGEDVSGSACYYQPPPTGRKKRPRIL
jgi:hypothetical protein